MTSIPASRRARAMILAPLSWPSRPTFATTTLIVRSIASPILEDLARVQDAFRVGEPLYLAHEGQGVAVLLPEVLRLAEAYAVLPCAGAAAREGVGDDLGVDLLGLLEVFGAHREDGVVVAVADVAEDSPVEAALSDGVAGMAQRLVKAADRYAHVGGHGLPVGVELLNGEGGLVARLPQPLPSGLVLLEVERLRAFGPGDLSRHSHVALDGGLGAAELEEQRRRDGVGGALVGVHGLNSAGVHQLHATDLHPRPDHGDRRPPRPLDIREGCPGGEDVLRDRVKAQDYLGEHAQSALRADEESGQVVSGRGLHRHPAGAHDGPVREHHLESKDLIPHRPVAHGVSPARVGGDHPAQRSVPAGIHREEEPVLFEAPVESPVRNARLNPGQEVAGPDLEDLVHQAEIYADTASSRDRLPLQAAPLPEGDYGDAARAGETQEVYDLIPVFREDDGVGGMCVVVGEDPSPVALDLFPVGADAVFRQDVSQPRYQILPLHLLRSSRRLSHRT